MGNHRADMPIAAVDDRPYGRLRQKGHRCQSRTGWDDDTFLSAYRENRRGVSESASEADNVAVAIREFVVTEHPDGWEGTATQLLAEINQRTAEGIRKTRSWPLTARAAKCRLCDHLDAGAISKRGQQRSRGIIAAALVDGSLAAFDNEVQD